MFYYRMFAFFLQETISFAPTIVPPFPFADSALVRVASTEATHIVLSNALSFFSIFVCIVGVPCDFSSTKETGHWALFIQIAARFAAWLFALPLLSASLRLTFFCLIFCFEALIAGEPLGRPWNSASATCRFVNVFIFDIGRCA
jgi:hypothetical protein